MCVLPLHDSETNYHDVLITLSADNHGEGGIFVSGLCWSGSNKIQWLIVPCNGSALLADGIITPPHIWSSAVKD
jgi:KUP system potassium uptake protein